MAFILALKKEIGRLDFVDGNILVENVLKDRT